MKRFQIVLIAVLGLLSALNVNAQTNVLSSGMSIQGIARDDKNEALANIDQLDLVFNVYYLAGSSTSPTTILNRTATVKTDNFGVFSYVLVIDRDQYNLISTQSAYLKVSQGSVVFSDEKLQTVPYAIYAQNGVPSGTITAYVGTVAPNGWMFCDGGAIPADPYYSNLKAVLGNANNTPDLRAMFLRGSGTGNGRTGPAVNTIQQDDLKAHLHTLNINTSNDGNHFHTSTFNNDDWNGTGGGQHSLENDGGGYINNLNTSTNGAHTHNVNGSTANTGGTETRPISYGVNWIIKI
jgi:microcystin-dependent protein